MPHTARPFDALSPGDTADITCTPALDDILVFANAAGASAQAHDQSPPVPGPWLAAKIAGLIDTQLPGPGARHLGQSFEYPNQAHAGDEITLRVTLSEVLPDRQLRLTAEAVRTDGGLPLLKGSVLVEASQNATAAEAAPGVVLLRHRHFERLLDQAAPLPPLVTAVVAPEEPNALGGALLAMEHSIIRPILIGDPAKIEAAARTLGRSLDGAQIIAEPDHDRAAHRGVDLIAEGEAGALMKGHVHTDQILRAALRRDRGLRAGRRFTHVFVMDVPGLDRPLLITDAAVNIQPDLKTKVDIVQNAIDVALSLGIAAPKVAVLSAVETVNPDLPSSLEAALLAKMADRGQITGGLVDGPLAMDNAVSLEAAKTKGLTSPVAGQADVLVAPNIDAGNMLFKQLAYVANAEAAGLVLGASAPIILNSRSDNDSARLASCAVAALHEARLKG